MPAQKKEIGDEIMALLPRELLEREDVEDVIDAYAARRLDGVRNDHQRELIRTGEADTYASEVDDLVIRLEALHQALEETNPG